MLKVSLVAAMAAISSAAFAQVGAGAVQIGGAGNSAPGTLATQVGGFQNVAIGGGSTVVGGGNNGAGLFASVTGGRFNLADTYAGVSSGYANSSTVASQVGSGVGNAASNFSFVGAGVSNIASGIGSVVAGGGSNQATAVGASVLGGSNNRATANYSAVLAGFGNTASGDGAVVVSGRFASAATSGSVVIADQLTTAANATNNSLLLSFANGVVTSATLKESSVGVNVTRAQAAGAAGQTAPATAAVTIPEGGNLIRLINSGIDVTNTAGNFAVANLTQNQTVVIDRIVPVFQAGTQIKLLVDNVGVVAGPAGTQRQSRVFFRDAVTANQTPAAAPAISTDANLQLGAPIIGLNTNNDPNVLTAGAFVQNTNAPINFEADDDDTLHLVSDGTRWVEVSRSSN